MTLDLTAYKPAQSGLRLSADIRNAFTAIEVAVNALAAVYEQGSCANVTMTNADQFYDGPSVALTVGTWLITGHVMIGLAASPAYWDARLSDGTTVGGQVGNSIPSGLFWGSASLSYIAVVAAGGATWKMAASCHTAGATLYAASAASGICAIKIGA